MGAKDRYVESYTYRTNALNSAPCLTESKYEIPHDLWTLSEDDKKRRTRKSFACSCLREIDVHCFEMMIVPNINHVLKLVVRRERGLYTFDASNVTLHREEHGKSSPSATKQQPRHVSWASPRSTGTYTIGRIDNRPIETVPR